MLSSYPAQPTRDSLTEVWRAVEVMSPGPSGCHVDFTPILLEKHRASTQDLTLVHPNNLPLRKDLSNVP